MHKTTLAILSVLALAACTVTPIGQGKQQIVISWGIENPETDDTGMTSAQIVLNISDDAGAMLERVDLGEYAGCGPEEAPEDGPLLTLKCWWAGGGDDFQVRMEGTNKLIIDHRFVDETQDIPDFEPIEEVTIAEGITIVPRAN